MKRILLTSLVAISGLAAGSAFAGCTEPVAVTDVPKGASASRDDMLAAQRAVKAYDTAVKAYTDCLQQAGDTSGKGNEAVDKLQKIADRFNQELRAFKEKNSAS
jgi:hypothetical protein